MRTLFSQFILRYLLRERLRSLLTAVGIALGIAVILAVRMANTSSLRGFESALESIAGRTSLEITAPGGRIEEGRLLEVNWLERYGELSPVVESEARVMLAGRPDEILRILGVDILRDRPLRDYRLVEFADKGREARVQEFLTLLVDPSSVILTERFARRSGVAVGQQITLSSGTRTKRFVVRGLLKDQGPARALDGNFALMDIAAAQWAFDSLGLLTRIDLRLERPETIDKAELEITAKLPQGLAVQRPARRTRQVEKMLASFHFNLEALSYIALLVGLFLIYSTVSVSVIARREEIGTLRALGVGRRSILALFLGEALILALVGCALGLPMARLLASAAVKLTSTTVSVLYRSVVSAPPPLGLGDLILSLAVVLPLSLAAAAAPAAEAARSSPSEAMRGTDRLETRFRLRAGHHVFPAALLSLGWWLSRFDAVGGLPVCGFLSALCLMLGGAALTPTVLFLLGKIGRRPMARFFRVEGLLAHANLAGSIPRLSVSVAALALSLSMMAAIAIMIGSFRDTVTYWVGQTLRADLFVSPSLRTRAGGDAVLPPDLPAEIARHPDVAAVDPFRRVDVPYRDATIMVGAGDFDVMTRYGGLLFKSPRDGMSVVRQARDRNAVIVSESLALRYQLGAGGTLTLPTPRGPADFSVAAVYYDYSSDRGIAVMDRGVFTHYFGNRPPTSLTIYLRQGSDPERVRSELLARLGNSIPVLIQTNISLRREVLRIFDSTFAITYALEAISVIIAILGVAATLITLMLDRRRELAILRLVGAERRQLSRMVIIEAFLMGVASQAIGLAVGVVLSLLLIYVINVQSFGWTIQFHLPAAFLARMSLLVLLATAFAGVYPARRASRIRAVDHLVEE